MGNLQDWYERHWGRWETKHETPIYLYQENTLTGKRRSVRKNGYGGHSPMNTVWLDGGDWYGNRPPPPAPMSRTTK